MGRFGSVAVLGLGSDGKDNGKETKTKETENRWPGATEALQRRRGYSAGGQYWHCFAGRSVRERATGSIFERKRTRSEAQMRFICGYALLFYFATISNVLVRRQAADKPGQFGPVA